MSLTNYTLYSDFLGTTPPMSSGNFTVISGEVEQAVKDFLGSNVEQQIYSNVTLTAPTSTKLVLPERPVAIDGNLTIAFNPQANGNVSAFTGNDTLTLYGDYTISADTNNANQSSSGVLTLVNTLAWWSFNSYGQPPTRLAYKKMPILGAVLATWRGGYATVPGPITLATNLAISLLWNMRTTGMPVTARSLDGISVSYAGPPNATDVVRSPGVSGLISTKYRAVDKFIGWPQ